MQADKELLREIMESDHPAAERFSHWLCDELLPALDPFGLRGPPGAGDYDWPGTQADFDAMIAEAVNVVRPIH